MIFFRWIRSRRAQQLGLPPLLPFLRVLLRAQLGRARPPTTLTREQHQVAVRVTRLADDAVVVQRSPVDAAETAALVAGCWGSGRRVHAEWPAAELATSSGRARFARWHRTIITQGLLPYVVVAQEVDVAGNQVGLIFDGSEIQRTQGNAR